MIEIERDVRLNINGTKIKLTSSEARTLRDVLLREFPLSYHNNFLYNSNLDPVWRKYLNNTPTYASSNITCEVEKA